MVPTRVAAEGQVRQGHIPGRNLGFEGNTLLMGYRRKRTGRLTLRALVSASGKVAVGLKQRTAEGTCPEGAPWGSAGRGNTGGDIL